MSVPDPCRHESHGGPDICRMSSAGRRHTPELLELMKEAFAGVASFVELWRNGVRHADPVLHENLHENMARTSHPFFATLTVSSVSGVPPISPFWTTGNVLRKTGQPAPGFTSLTLPTFFRSASECHSPALIHAARRFSPHPRRRHPQRRAPHRENPARPRISRTNPTCLPGVSHSRPW